MSSDPLPVRLETIVVEAVFKGGIHGPRTAVTRILADPELAGCLKAAEIVAQLDAEHRPRRWAPDSPTVSCTAGCGSYPCQIRKMLP